MKIVYTIILFLMWISCDNEGVSKKHAEAVPSFTPAIWDFNNVTFEQIEGDTVSFKLYHYNDSSEIIDKILLMRIPTQLDSIHLLHREAEVNPRVVVSAFYFITIGDDAQGEHYVLDSTKNSYILLDFVSNSRIEGRFHLNFIISSNSLLPKFAPYIPDTFSLTEGRFNARRL